MRIKEKLAFWHRRVADVKATSLELNTFECKSHMLKMKMKEYTVRIKKIKLNNSTYVEVLQAYEPEVASKNITFILTAQDVKI